jgi:integrase
MGSHGRVKLPNLHQKGRAYYYVTPRTRKWIPLGSDIAVALRRYERLHRQPSRGTIGSIVDAYVEGRRGKVADSTLEMYDVWARHLIRILGDLLVDELTRGDVLRYLDECPRTSGRNEIGLLRAAFERAVRRGEADVNPCVGAKAEDAKPSRRTRLLSDDEIVRIRAAGSELLQVALDLACLTGLRPSDLATLRWGELDAGHVRTRKTGARIRFSLTDDLRAVLDAARALSPRVATLTVLSERGQPTTARRLSDLFRIASRAAGVEDAQLRDVRAKAATDAEQAGQDPQRLLGHTTPQTTRTYLRGRNVVTVDPVRRRKA